MEINGIDQIQSLKMIGKSNISSSISIEDTLSISAESQKKAEWVEITKAMPDLRTEKIEAYLQNPPIEDSPKIIMAIANKVFSSD